MLSKAQISSVLSECLAVGTVDFHVPNNLQGAFDIDLTPEGSAAPLGFSVAVRSLTRDTREAGVWVDRLKIQKTGLRGVQSLDALLGLTIIGGQPVFVAFDAGYHIPTSGGSTNVQCPEALVLDAAMDLRFHHGSKEATGESLVAFPGHLLAAYLLGIGGATTAPTPDRNEAWYESRRRVRDPNFRDLVLSVYDHRCGLCGIGMDFPEAAHIVPHCVSLDDSPENGLALCPNHHAAYDRLGVLSFTGERAAVVNRARLQYYYGVDPASVDAFLSSIAAHLRSVDIDQTVQLTTRFSLDVERWDPSVWCTPDEV